MRQIRASWWPLVVGALLAGCRSEQAVFSFQPLALNAPRRTGRPLATAPRRAATRPAAPASSSANSSNLAHLTGPLPTAEAPAQHWSGMRGAGRALDGASSPAPTAPDYAAPVVARRASQLWHRAAPTDAPAHATEAGLGRTVLFLVGVVLAGLAGLAALLSLIPGVSFWGGLGLAVGGLLGLGLLFKLLKGGKKK